MKSVIVVIAASLLAGCAARAPEIWVKDAGFTQAGFERDKEQCLYEVSAATQQTDYGYRTIVVQEIERATRQRDLAVKCMGARGYRLTRQ